MRALYNCFMLMGVFLIGCGDLGQITEADINKVIVCNSPYIRHAGGCCLDQNENKICDNDEKDRAGKANVVEETDFKECVDVNDEGVFGLGALCETLEDCISLVPEMDPSQKRSLKCVPTKFKVVEKTIEPYYRAGSCSSDSDCYAQTFEASFDLTDEQKQKGYITSVIRCRLQECEATEGYITAAEYVSQMVVIDPGPTSGTTYCELTRGGYCAGSDALGQPIKDCQDIGGSNITTCDDGSYCCGLW